MGQDVFKLIQAGVCSFKIEGRMRSAAYVGSAVKYYRDILDQKTEKEKEDYSDLCRAFNRGGFTRGYAFGQDPNLISSDIQGHAGEKVLDTFGYRAGRVFVEVHRWAPFGEE